MKRHDIFKFWAVTTAFATWACAVTMVRAGGPADVTFNDVYWFDDFSLVEGGVSKLVRTDRGVSMDLSTNSLEPGAYTAWWIMFQNPAGCVLGPGLCGEHGDDFTPGGPAGFGFGFATGHIVDESGEATFGAHLKVGTALYDDNFDPIVLENARTAEIHQIVRYHGESDPGRIPEQIHTGEFDDPTVVDVQFAVNPVPLAAAAVPEPSCRLLLMFAAAVLLVRRWR